MFWCLEYVLKHAFNGTAIDIIIIILKGESEEGETHILINETYCLLLNSTDKSTTISSVIIDLNCQREIITGVDPRSQGALGIEATPPHPSR